MSVNGKLQKMLNGNETGSYLTLEKKQELDAINEALFKGALGSLGNIAGKIKSAVGKGLVNSIGYISGKGFSSAHGAKSLKDLDAKLSAMKVDDPEFFNIILSMFEQLRKSEDAKWKPSMNPKLFQDLFPIFKKHYDRFIEYAIKNITTPKDEKTAKEFTDTLNALLGVLKKSRNTKITDLYEKLQQTLTDLGDKKTLGKVGKMSDEELANAQKIDDEFSKMQIDDQNMLTKLQEMFNKIVEAEKEKSNKADGVIPVFVKHMKRFLSYYDALVSTSIEEAEKKSYTEFIESIINMLETTRVKEIVTLKDEAKNKQMEVMDSKVKPEAWTKDMKLHMKKMKAGENVSPYDISPQELEEDVELFKQTIKKYNEAKADPDKDKNALRALEYNEEFMSLYETAKKRLDDFQKALDYVQKQNR